MKRKRNGGFAFVNKTFEFFSAAQAADEVDALVGANVFDAQRIEQRS